MHDDDLEVIVAEIIRFVQLILDTDDDFLQLKRYIEIKNQDEMLEQIANDTANKSLNLPLERRGLLLISALTEAKVKNLYYQELIKLIDHKVLEALETPTDKPLH